MFPPCTPPWACFAALVLLTITRSVFSEEDSADLANAYNEGMAQFQAGNYARAATDLEALIARVEVSPQVEPIAYTVGCAWFNAAEYAKAIVAFKSYQKKFPKGPHAGAVAFAIAQSNLLGRNYEEAAAQMTAFENNPEMRERALLFEGQAFKGAGKTDDAMRALEKLVGKQIGTSDAMHGAIVLAQLYAQKGEGAKAVQTLGAMHLQVALVDNLLELNTLTVDLGDKFYNQQQYREALACYRFTWSHEQVVRLENERITAMQHQIEQNCAVARADPAKLSRFSSVNNQIRQEITNAQKQLAEFKQLPSITPAIYLRLARCFYELDQKWEAIVVNQEILDRFKKGPEREPALFALIVALADVNQSARAEERCKEYLRDFKDGPNAATVAYLLGAVALQAGEPKAAESHFDQILQTQPNSPFREQIRFLIGNARFSAASYDAAIAAYKQYLGEFPKGANVEDVRYRIILCAVFAGRYQDAMAKLQNYIRDHPNSAFLPDAKYRLMVCKYAASLYDEVISDCERWEGEFPDDAQLGEVLALLGDAYAASDREQAAIPIYIRSYKTAATDEVMNYSLLAASKLLQKENEWGKIAELFAGFVTDKPDNPTVVSAIYWIGKAKVHEGKIDEAKRLAAETINKHIADPGHETVEQLITQLAQLCVRKRALTGGGDPGGKGRSMSQPAATVLAQPGAELDQLLLAPANKDSGTALARILFARAELARLRRKPIEEKKYIGAIAGLKPEDLSPLLLGKAGDYLLEKGKVDQAGLFYQELLDNYPKSQLVDLAYNGLGEIAYLKKAYKTALSFFADGIDTIAAGQKRKDLAVGRAKTLLALGKLDAAQKAFEEIASIREWRGDATAFSVYALGEIAARRGKWPEANACFQRVYVAYQKFLPWVAKAYIASGESFEKLNKKEEAAKTYREMLRNEKLTAFPEAAEARKRLEALGQG